MSCSAPSPTLLMATTNPGKVRELKNRLDELNISLKTLVDFPVPAPEETGQTFVENASLKARYYAEISGLPTLADDSGLVLPALEGFPGIYSGRFAEEAGGYPEAFQILQDRLQKTGDKRALMQAVLVFQDGQGIQTSFTGHIEGHFIFPPRGTHGFGYDPIFQPQGYDVTFAEDPLLKQRLSHRQQAVQEFIEYLKSSSSLSSDAQT